MAQKYAKLLMVALLTTMLVSACDKQAEEAVAPEQQNAAEKMEPVRIPITASPAGNYLAARFAIANDDLKVASDFYGLALTEGIDREFLTERALPAAIGAGDFKTALQLTKEIDLKKPTATSQLAVTVLLVDAFKKNDKEQIDILLPLLRDDGFGRLLLPLLDVWAKIGKENATAALARLDGLNKEYPSLGPLVEIHKALIYDYLNDEKKAEQFYIKSLGNRISVRSVYVVGQFYERHNEIEKAKKLYQELQAKIPTSPLPSLVLERLDKGTYLDKPFVAKPKDGVAAALYDVATVLHQENSSRLAILYAQMAHYLTPEDDFTIMLLGDILSNSAVASQSEEYFQSIPQQSDLYVLAQLRLAQIYELQKKSDKAEAILNDLAKNPLVKRQALNEMADMYRGREKFAEAIPYYTQVIDGIAKPVETDWVLYYARGICFERTGDWTKAEADLQQALKLSPNQPEVLNYLAYSWADHGQNLEQALDMLEKALTGAPDDPYITDSVGWALYKIGRAQDAVPFLEVAAQQLPDDPTINEHLGDLYWTLDRKLEAGFQWERALKFVSKNDELTKRKIQEKLEKGLPDESKPKEAAVADEAIHEEPMDQDAGEAANLDDKANGGASKEEKKQETPLSDKGNQGGE